MREWKLDGLSGPCSLLLEARLEDLPALCGPRRVLIVTDTRVREAQGRRLEQLGDWAFPPAWVEVGQGEEAKTLDTVAALYRTLQDLDADRNLLVLGLGGGVVTDLAGFAAATWLRGLPFAFAPTTLLAQVDAALGGKNGVNFGGAKNQVGTIRQPAFVLLDPSCLATLDPRELRSGLAEALKCALIEDAELFDFIENNAEALREGDGDALARAMSGSVSVKAALVQADEFEQGPRMLLNFGHTLGHALEALEAVAIQEAPDPDRAFSPLKHGEAVALGMLAACRLSAALGLLDPAFPPRLQSLLARLGLPHRLEAGPVSTALALLRRDKKRKGGRLTWALLQAPGSAVLRPLDLEAAGTLLAGLVEPAP